MHERSDRETAINTGLITALCITKCELSSLCCFHSAELFLIKRSNQLLVGSVEFSIRFLLVILLRTDIHGELGLVICAMLTGLDGSYWQQHKGIKVFRKPCFEIGNNLSW